MHVDELKVSGLRKPASISIDDWGIPHIRAESMDDMFFVQGFNAARDRLWQIDLWRKRGLGLLAEDFGPGYLEQDRAARLFLYRGDMQSEWDAYSTDSSEICSSFVNGVNAFIDILVERPELMPLEFTALDTKPAKWKVEDVVKIRSHALMRNVVSEVLRANVMSQSGIDADLLRQNLEPKIIPSIPEGIELGEIPIEVLDVFKLAVAAVSFEDARLSSPLADVEKWRKVSPLGAVVRDTAGQGSNNWVISGTNTSSGRPILANDPHRAYAAPSLRYIVQLSCPEFDGIGAGEPALPGISIGHNGALAFGLTLFFGPDQEDLYIYETSEDDPNLYRYGDGWERMDVEVETARVKGHDAQHIELKFTRHGPVIFEDRAARRAYAVRTVWSEPGSAPYFGSISSMRSRDVHELKDNLERWGVPAVNKVGADTKGNICWVASGFSPKRPNWDGLLPVPGDGRFEWAGFNRAGDLPHVCNPAEGFFSTANEFNIPEGWSLPAQEIGYEWIEDSRARRIEERLLATDQHTIATSRDLQTDVQSIAARRLTALVSAIDPNIDGLAPALRMFAGWDGALSADSNVAALFEVWWSRHLRPAIVKRVSREPSSVEYIGIGDPASVLLWLEDKSRSDTADAQADRDGLLQQTLVEAYRACVTRFGPDAKSWRWGALHHAYFEHALSYKFSQTLDVGPFPLGGSESSPMNAQYRLSDFRSVIGASVRLVIDVGDWDSSVCINTPGQSGDPRSIHYRDLAERWATGDYVPLRYSASAVDQATRTLIKLSPK